MTLAHWEVELATEAAYSLTEHLEWKRSSCYVAENKMQAIQIPRRVVRIPDTVNRPNLMHTDINGDPVLSSNTCMVLNCSDFPEDHVWAAHP